MIFSYLQRSRTVEFSLISWIKMAKSLLLPAGIPRANRGFEDCKGQQRRSWRSSIRESRYLRAKQEGKRIFVVNVLGDFGLISFPRRSVGFTRAIRRRLRWSRSGSRRSVHKNKSTRIYSSTNRRWAALRNWRKTWRARDPRIQRLCPQRATCHKKSTAGT